MVDKPIKSRPGASGKLALSLCQRAISINIISVSWAKLLLWLLSATVHVTSLLDEIQKQYGKFSLTFTEHRCPKDPRAFGKHQLLRLRGEVKCYDELKFIRTFHKLKA